METLSALLLAGSLAGNFLCNTPTGQQLAFTPTTMSVDGKLIREVVYLQEDDAWVSMDEIVFLLRDNAILTGYNEKIVSRTRCQ